MTSDHLIQGLLLLIDAHPFIPTNGHVTPVNEHVKLVDAGVRRLYKSFSVFAMPPDPTNINYRAPIKPLRASSTAYTAIPAAIRVCQYGSPASLASGEVLSLVNTPNNSTASLSRP